MQIMRSNIPDTYLSEEEYQFLSQFRNTDISVQDIWQIMDDVWEELDITDYSKDIHKIATFYRSPVWLLNGLFTECDHTSIEHREGIVAWISEHDCKEILDYGGGYGSLARKISNDCNEAIVKIVEPYPTAVSTQLNRQFPNLQYLHQLPESASADVAIIQDVLEHVPDPLSTFAEVLSVVKPGKYAITANCFYPVMKCHLPKTFHFRYSFRFIAAALGCRYIGTVPNVQHAQIFQKSDDPCDWEKARWMEKLSCMAFPLLEIRKKIVEGFNHSQ